jgi:hypothetical protein
MRPKGKLTIGYCREHGIGIFTTYRYKTKTDTRCRACRRASALVYSRYKCDRERKNEYLRRYRAKPEFTIYQRNYYLANKERIIANLKKRRAAKAAERRAAV